MEKACVTPLAGAGRAALEHRAFPLWMHEASLDDIERVCARDGVLPWRVECLSPLVHACMVVQGEPIPARSTCTYRRGRLDHKGMIGVRKHYPSMRIAPPWSAIYRRLGFKAGTTELREGERVHIDRLIQEGIDLVELKGASLVLGIKGLGEGGVLLEGDVLFPSASLAGMLAGCTGALIMAATAGRGIVEAIERSSADDLTRAVVYDAVGSEMADAALDWIVSAVGQDLVRMALRPTRKRFSSGYGDLGLESQQTIWEMLRLEELGIGLTPSMMLVPGKSVTAVAGVVTLA